MSAADGDRLRAQQAALARALTRPEAATDAAMEPLLNGLDRDEIARAAETLVRKRLSQTQSALPGTARLLGGEFRPEFREFAARHPFGGPGAIWQDAIRFCDWLLRRRNQPAWMRDVLRWERARCVWESRPFCFVVLRLRHGVAASSAGMGVASTSAAPPRRMDWVWAWRVGGRGHIYKFPGTQSCLLWAWSRLGLLLRRER